MAEINIKALLDGDQPRLIDEWQTIPKFWDAVRFRVDSEQGFGRYILTGSAVPADTGKIVHSGTGRIARLTMRTMTWAETGESSGTVSLGDLLDSVPVGTAQAQRCNLETVAFRLCRGGWPAALDLKRPDALVPARDYIEAIAESDISRFDGVSRNPSTARRVMRSYARLQGTSANLSAIRADVCGGEGRSGASTDTIAAYINALRGIFVVDDVAAWCPNLRNKAQIRVSDTRYFGDSSMATASIGAWPGNLMADLPTMGLVFKTAAVHDLRVYAQANGGSIGHYLDSAGLECDAVVHLPDGRFGLVEIKLGGEALIGAGAETLVKVERKLDVGKTGLPAFKMVLTAVGDYAYTRPEDGVTVCPLGALKE